MNICNDILYINNYLNSWKCKHNLFTAKTKNLFHSASWKDRIDILSSYKHMCSFGALKCDNKIMFYHWLIMVSQSVLLKKCVNCCCHFFSCCKFTSFNCESTDFKDKNSSFSIDDWNSTKTAAGPSFPVFCAYVVTNRCQGPSATHYLPFLIPGSRCI